MNELSVLLKSTGAYGVTGVSSKVYVKTLFRLGNQSKLSLFLNKIFTLDDGNKALVPSGIALRPIAISNSSEVTWESREAEKLGWKSSQAAQIR